MIAVVVVVVAAAAAAAVVVADDLWVGFSSSSGVALAVRLDVVKSGYQNVSVFASDWSRSVCFFLQVVSDVSTEWHRTPRRLWIFVVLLLLLLVCLFCCLFMMTKNCFVVKQKKFFLIYIKINTNA